MEDVGEKVEDGETYTGRPRVIFSLLPEAPPRLHESQYFWVPVIAFFVMLGGR